jgi:serine/threonine protein kinase/TolB-like protein/Tfp pilus assembly protein PilF
MVGGQPMTRDDWQRIKRIAGEATERLAPERPAFIAEACGTDAALQREVEALLKSIDASEHLYETPAVSIDGHSFVEAFGRQALVPGSMVGSYRIVREIGRGGMGRVFLGERADALFERQVAIKIVRLGADPELLVEHFTRERHILAALEHPNIARLLDAGATDDGLPYVVMDYVAGVPIDEYCDANHLDLRARLELFCRVCAIVEAAHERAIVHRDLKPGNILVTADGTPKLLDFGIAKNLDAMPGGAVTQTAQRLLTPMSAAPEQLSGGPTTPAIDVYALGVLLYQLVAGEHPFAAQANNAAALERAILRGSPRPPSSVKVTTGDLRPISTQLGAATALAIDTVTLTALRKEPAERYRSVRALADDVRSVRAGARPIGAGALAFAPLSVVSRYPRVLLLSAAVIATMAAAAWWMAEPPPAAPKGPAMQTVAVRPFRDTPDDDNKLGWGMADALVTRLGAVHGLRVRVIVDGSQPQDAGAPVAAGAGDIDAFIDGTIERSGGRVRVHSRLVDARSRAAVWSSQSEGDSAELFAIQDRLSLDIARRILPQFDGSGMRARSGTGSEQAYDAFVQGRYYLSLGTPDSVRTALWHFERSAAADPLFASAQAELATTYAWLRNLSPLSPPDQSRRGREAAARALGLDPLLGEAHAALGVFMLIDDWNWTEAERELRRAIELSPNEQQAVVFYAAGLAAHHRFDEALEHLRRAADNDPVSRSLPNQLVRVLYMSRRFHEAVDECDRVLATEPSFRMSFCGLSRIEAGAGQDGFAELEMIASRARRAGNLSALGYAYARAGRTAEALSLADDIEHLAEEEGCVPYYVAEVKAGLGDREGAAAQLERARQAHCPTVMMRIQVDPKFDLFTAQERARFLMP